MASGFSLGRLFAGWLRGIRVPSGYQSLRPTNMQASSLVFAQIAVAVGWGLNSLWLPVGSFAILRFGAEWCNPLGSRWGNPDCS